ATKANLTTHRFDAAADRLDHGRQAIAPQVRAIIVEDGRPPLALRKQLEHTVNQRSGRATSELAVAERAGAPFTEEVIAFGIERAAGVEASDIMNALPYRGAALQY